MRVLGGADNFYDYHQTHLFVSAPLRGASREAAPHAEYRHFINAP
ncbi:MAG: hypothetical protein AAFU38_06610 [Bacteroidota bacterium]